MPSLKRMPLRPSLLSEVTTVLREGIAAGRWKERLPGERQLALDLQVSRPTINLALRALEKEGVLESSPKMKRRIMHRQARRRSERKPVVLISSVPLEFMEQHTMLWVDILRQNLARIDIELMVHFNRRIYSRGSGKLLEQLVRETPASCWVLTLSTREMQNWFATRKLPTVVAGSLFRGTVLPSIDLDFRAVGRHAAGMLLSKGFKKICLVNRHPIHAGDKLTEMGFCEAFAKRPSSTETPLIVHHDGTPSGIRAVIDRVQRGKVQADAYFVTSANHVLTVISSLARHGRVLGQNYFLISRDDDAFLNYIFPPIPCYSRDHERYSRAAFRLIQKTMEEPGSPPASLRIMPDFKASTG